MPRIIVESVPTDTEAPVRMLAERVLITDLESEHFASQLIERLGWAVSDAAAVEVTPSGHRRG